MSFLSYAQNFEDVLLWRAFHDISSGCYIDIGAQDPEIDSVSLAFYSRGWRGIHIEPTPSYATRLRDARPDERVVEAIVSDVPGPAKFFEFPDTGLSTGKTDIAEQHREKGFDSREIVVATITLKDVLELAEHEIHWLKIDVEGMEVEVLRSWGQSSVRPWVLVIEATFPSTSHHSEHRWLDEVLSRGYKQAIFDGLNFYFVHEDHSELADRISTPANVFDRFTVASWHFTAGQVRTELEVAQSELREQRGRAEQLSKERSDLAQERDLARHDQSRAADTLSKVQEDNRQREARFKVEQIHERREFQHKESKLSAELAKSREEHRIREERFNEYLARAHEARETTERELKTALGRLVITEQNNRTMLLTQSRERQIIEQKYLDRWQELNRQLREAETAGTAAKVEVARLSERNSSLELRIDETCQLLRLSNQRLSDSEQTRTTIAAELERLRQMISQADALINRIRAEPRSRWQRFGEMLGVARSSEALNALVALSSVASHSCSIENSARQITMAETSSIMHQPNALSAKNPYLRAETLAELQAWCDVDFIRCAYVTMLGRQPDPEGEAHYTNRIRAGHSKLEVLWELRRSSDGRQHDPGIQGLDRALKRAALGRKPLIGAIVRVFTRTEPDDWQTRRWRSLWNGVECLRISQKREFALLSSKIEAVSAGMSKEVSVAGAVIGVADHQTIPPAQLSNLSNRARDIFAAMANVR